MAKTPIEATAVAVVTGRPTIDGKRKRITRTVPLVIDAEGNSTFIHPIDLPPGHYKVTLNIPIRDQ